MPSGAKFGVSCRRTGIEMDLLSFGLRAAVAVLLGLTLPGYTGRQAPQVEQGDIYYHSQAEADAALDQFGRDNPTCELWTNWQKACVRGADGAAICYVDRGRRVRPSVPFCTGAVARADGRDPTRLPANATAIRRSIERFCLPRRVWDPDMEYYDGSDGSFSPSSVCVFSSRRPFFFGDYQSRDEQRNRLRRLVPAEPNSNDSFSYQHFQQSLPEWCDLSGNPTRDERSNTDVDSPDGSTDIFFSRFNYTQIPVTMKYCRFRIEINISNN